MSKLKNCALIVEEQNKQAFIEEADARYQTLEDELQGGGLTREECISHEEELEIIQDI